MSRYMIDVERADKTTINMLIASGVLYVDKTCTHAGESGNYLVKKKAPTTAKSEGAFK